MFKSLADSRWVTWEALLPLSGPQDPHWGGADKVLAEVTSLCDSFFLKKKECDIKMKT